MRLDFCVACGRKNDLNHHHAIPRVYGGPDDDANLITLCRECHGRIHGAEWKLGIADAIKTGLASARERGIKPGRKSYAERDPQMVALAQHLRGGNDHRPYSLRDVAADLAAYGYVTPSGKPYSASAVQSMLDAA